MGEDEELPHLGPDMRDRAVSAIRGAGALVPHGGRLVGSLLGSIIPGQRLDRIESYLRIVGDKIEQLSEDQQRLIAASPEHIDLFEEGAFRAARALNEKRIAHIAFVVEVGMTKGTAEAISQKRLLSILGDLDEQDIIMLNWRVEINKLSGNKYAENHPELLGEQWPPMTIWSKRDQREEDALKRAIDNKLLRYGLIDLVDDMVPRGMSPRKTKIITQLGLLILRTVGLSDNSDIQP